MERKLNSISQFEINKNSVSEYTPMVDSYNKGKRKNHKLGYINEFLHKLNFL